MPDTKISALSAATVVNSADQFALVQSAASKSVTMAVLQSSLGAGYRNSSVSTVSAGFAADTYLAGSAVTVPAGAFKVGSIYSCGFDMVKTGAGTAAFTITLRMGTLGTTGDGSIVTFAYAVGTAVPDTGWFDVFVSFRTVGSGTSAVVVGASSCSHHLAATGLITTGASGYGLINNQVSGGFNSTTQTIIGISVNGGASFSGTNTIVQSFVLL